MRILKFICEECGHNKMEVIERVTTTKTTLVTSIDTDGDIDYKQEEAVFEEGGVAEIECYQCAECGNSILDDENESITNPNALANWLAGQHYNQSVPESP